ncbi:hypothetical protein HOLleu_20738 [Holothuria leucospilota]|uniref:Uncharacterized protein n=1 Tax=Holothuria leucospilota TaxID=206669 RepID=A0A9Q1H874_HOLLE|nr:hypothetical protein HOLleu_20738 [Holothuria leucospilota]
MAGENSPFLKALSDFQTFLTTVRNLQDVIDFERRTGLTPAIKLLEMSRKDKDFGLVHTRWGRGGKATPLEHFVPEVVAFAQEVRQLIDHWFDEYKKTTMVEMFHGLEARGMDFILRVDVLFV